MAFAWQVQEKVAVPCPASVADAGVGPLSTVEAAPPMLNDAGARTLTVPSPPLVTWSETVNVWSRITSHGALTVALRAAGSCTVARSDCAIAVGDVAPSFASVPAALDATCSVPADVPLSTKVHWKVALEPPGIVTAVGTVDVVAAAPPVAVTDGAKGSTPFAAASPVFATVIEAVKPWRRLIVDEASAERTVNEITESAARLCTVDEAVVLGAPIDAPLFASTPAAPALNGRE